MQINISISQPLTKKKSYELEQLATEIESSLKHNVVRLRSPGQSNEKNEELVIALTIANLAVTGFGTLVAFLSFRASQQERFSITYEKDGRTITHDNIAPENLQKTLTDIESGNDHSSVNILITKQ